MPIDFTRHRSMLYWITVGFFAVVCIAMGPLYEVYVDIGVTPPQNIRKTDFSWITVNEWFTTQTYIIKSHEILKDAALTVSEKKLADTITAKRLDSADIIRISARSNMDPFDAQDALTRITHAYLGKINGPSKKTRSSEEKQKEDIGEKGIEEIPEQLQEELRGLHVKRGQIGEKIAAEARRLAELGNNLDKVADNQAKIMNLKQTIAGMEESLSVKKQRLAALETTYASAWPEVSKLKVEIPSLEKEKEFYTKSLSDELLAAAEIQKHKNQMKRDVQESQRSLRALQDETGYIDERINEIRSARVPSVKKEPVIEEAVPVEERTNGYILNPPTINFLPQLWVRLVSGFLIGSFFWHVSVFLIKRKSSSETAGEARHNGI